MLRAISRLFQMTKSTRVDPVGKIADIETICSQVIFVTGCTGTGKSDLGIAIAKKFDGEVISADSMQIYKGQCQSILFTNSLRTRYRHQQGNRERNRRRSPSFDELP